MATPETLRLSDVAESITRRRRQIAVFALVGTLLGLLVALLIPTSYTATATVTVEPLSSSTSADSDPSVDMATEVGAALSRQVANAAAQRLGDGTTATSIGRRTAVENPERSRLLTFTSTADTAAGARRIADAVAQSYLQVRRDAAVQQIEELSSVIGGEIAVLNQKGSTAGRDAKARELGNRQARLLASSVVPGEVVTRAGQQANRVAPGPLPLGVAGLALGLVLGAGLAVVRKDPVSDPRIGSADRLDGIDSNLVLDGTHDAERSVTWDLAAFMLPVPEDRDVPFVIMVDSGPAVTDQVAAQELVKALSRRGEPATFVDAGAVHPGKISRGWPTERKRETWGTRVIVIDTARLASQASKVEIATRVDMVVLARSVDDDARDVRRLHRLLRSRDVSVDLVAIFPSAPEMITLGV